MVKMRILFAILACVPIVTAAACSNTDTPAQSTPPSGQPTTRTAAGGPNATLEPRSGPPGTEVIVSGSGWPARAMVQLMAESTSGQPYASVTANEDGSFSAKFRLEKQPNGAELQTGRFNLIARSGSVDVVLPFQVETRRPIDPRGPGG